MGSWICHKCETENSDKLLCCEVCDEPSPYRDVLLDEETWQNAIQANTEQAYNNYLTKFPEGNHRIAAKRRLTMLRKEKETLADDNLWNKTVAANTIDAYNSYVKYSTTKRYVEEAKAKAEELLWADTQKEGTELSYRNYLSISELNKHKREAVKLLDDVLWQAALKKDSLEGYREYISSTTKRLAELRTELPIKLKEIEERSWKQAEFLNNVVSYSTYLAKFEDGKYAARAKRKIAEFNDIATEEASWKNAVKSNSLSSYRRYLETSKLKKHASDAKCKIDDMLWQDALKKDTLNGYLEYKRESPSPRADLSKKLEELENQLWTSAQSADTITSYKGYLSKFKAGRYSDLAKQKIEQLKLVSADEALWADAVKTISISSLRNYLKNSQLKTHASDAEHLIDDMLWEAALKKGTVEGYKECRLQSPNLAEKCDAMIASMEETEWNHAVESSTIDAYQNYLTCFPESARSALARKKISALQDKEAWDDAKSKNTVSSYNTYLLAYPNGRFAIYARTRIDRLENQLWTSVQSTDTVASYNVYLSEFPSGIYAEEAKQRIEQLNVINEDEALWGEAVRYKSPSLLRNYLEKSTLRTHAAEAECMIEDMLWQKAQRNDTLKDYKEYLSQCNGGCHAAEAKAKIKQLTEISADEERWNKAAIIDTLLAYSNYLKNSTLKLHKKEAEERIVRIDDLEWRTASNANTEEKYRRYLNTFPNGRHAAEAAKCIKQLESSASMSKFFKTLFWIALVIAVLIIFASKGNDNKPVQKPVTPTQVEQPKPAPKLDANQIRRIESQLDALLTTMEADGVDPNMKNKAYSLLNQIKGTANYNYYMNRYNRLK